ncbi:hypothetical protein V8D89_012940 [Ganoderma adspersum]
MTVELCQRTNVASFHQQSGSITCPDSMEAYLVQDLLAFSRIGVDQHSTAEYDSNGRASNREWDPAVFSPPVLLQQPANAAHLPSPPSCASNPSADSDHAIRIVSAVAFGILYYDYALTFGMEVDRFWKRGSSFASFVFYFNRYLVLFGHIPVLYEFYGTSNQNYPSDIPYPSVGADKCWRCSKVQMYHQLLAGVIQVIAAGLQLFRIHGLYHCDRRITFALLALAIVCSAISVWSISQTWKQPSDQKHAMGIPSIGCDLMMTKTHVLAYDMAVFALTLYRVLGVESRWRGDILSILLRDGDVLLVCHLCNILTCIAVYRGISVTITNVIASSLISRLMLNLRDPHLLRNRYNDSELERSELPWRPRTNTAACSSMCNSDASTSSS